MCKDACPEAVSHDIIFKMRVTPGRDKMHKVAKDHEKYGLTFLIKKIPTAENVRCAMKNSGKSRRSAAEYFLFPSPSELNCSFTQGKSHQSRQLPIPKPNENCKKFNLTQINKILHANFEVVERADGLRIFKKSRHLHNRETLVYLTRSF